MASNRRLIHAVRFGTYAACFVAMLTAGHASATSVGIAAIVNDTIITTNDLAEREALMLAMAGGNIPDAARARMKSQALQLLISEALQQEEAKRLSIDISDEEVEEAIANLEKSRGRPPGSLRSFLQKNHIPARTMESQMRTQLGWNKVVTQRLRSNVTISEDEISRAQFSAANAPGIVHYNIAAISVPVTGKADEARAGKLVKEILDKIASGQSFETTAREYAGRKDVVLNPSIWIAEDKLEPPIAAALRGLKPGQVTRPLRSLKTFQIVQYRDRREIKPLPPETELVLKDTLFPIDSSAPKANFPALLAAAETLRKQPDACASETTVGTANTLTSNVTSKFIFGKMGGLSPDIIPLIALLQVGETSEPIASPQGLRLITLCEKIEPATALADRSEMEQKLFGEKIELEAVKHMRNLRRDAFIEVKTPVRATPDPS